ncbi:unnamed protein product [Hymenolepis diminuta]|uniref:Uncharacterized protein n=1 Tax=Hymenolepis diminuta TaxID=6216 RepID=A0A564Z6E5_HYMDI|nr:unnamed protein product [Hymenolepis diminuta]
MGIYLDEGKIWGKYPKEIKYYLAKKINQSQAGKMKTSRGSFDSSVGTAKGVNLITIVIIISVKARIKCATPKSHFPPPPPPPMEKVVCGHVWETKTAPTQPTRRHESSLMSGHGRRHLARRETVSQLKTTQISVSYGPSLEVRYLIMKCRQKV